MSAEVFDVHLLVDEMSEEVCTVPDEGGGQQAQELHYSVREALVIEHLQQAGHGAVLLHQLYHAVKLHPQALSRGARQAPPLPPRASLLEISTLKSSS